jgi:hypothetical protein
MHDPASLWWGVVSALGTWAAAFGSILAVWVALYLANRDRRIYLQLTAALGNEGGLEVDGRQREPDVLLSIRNAGRRSVMVRAFGFTTGLLPWVPARCGFLHRNAIFVQPAPGTPELRAQLLDGQICERTERYHPIMFNLASALPRPYVLTQWTIRFWALTTVDVRPSVRVTSRLRRRVVRVARQQDASHA